MSCFFRIAISALAVGGTINVYVLTLLVIIVAVTGIFVVVLLLSLIRMGRARHGRLGLDQKSEPTKYVDAWSMHRLKDDQVKDDQEHSD
jgi:uncharacterized membrane protein